MSTPIENLTIGQVCDLLDINPHTLRYWDRVLDLDIAKDNLSFRRYTPEDIEKLKTIKRLRNVNGLKYKDIKKSLDNHDNISLELIENKSIIADENIENFMNLLAITLENCIEKKIDNKLDLVIKNIDEMKSISIKLNQDLKIKEDQHYNVLNDKLSKWREEHFNNKIEKKKSLFENIKNVFSK